TQSFNNLPAVSGADADKPNLGMAAARMAGSFVGVCVVFVLLARMMGKRKTAPDRGNMEVLASLAIDYQSGVYMVRAGDRKLLMGIDSTGVKSLVEVPRAIVDPANEKPIPMPVVVHSTPQSDRAVVAELLTRLRAAA